MLGGLALSVMALVAFANARRGSHPDRTHAKPALPAHQQVRILVHAINDDRCVGCDACVAVCPTNVLDLINNKSRVLRFQDCIQCEQCMWACPTDALVMHPEGTEPPPIKTPEINENFETAVPGQYLIGEVAGKPLVKNAANLGRAVVEHMLKHGGLQPGAAGSDVLDVVIVGSGPGGLSAALTCIRQGLSYAVLEKEQMIASTVSRYPKGKWVMAEPYDVRNLSYLPVFDSSKEQMVPIWQEVVEKIGMTIKQGEPVESVQKGEDGVFDIKTTVAAYRAQRVILAIGTRGKPRTLGVPGENLPKVASLLEDPDEFRGQAVLVIGGGDSALEAAMALADSGARVVLSYRGKSFSRAQKKNQSAIDSYDAQKRIKVLYQSNVVQFTEDTVTIKLDDGQQKSYPNQATFVLIGAEPPVRWLGKVGVHVVEKPHSFSLGKTDEIIEGLVGVDNVIECPEEADAAVHLAREGSLPESVKQQAEQAAAGKTMMFGFQPTKTGARGWLKSAKTMFTQALRLDQPMPLSEFAKRGGGHGGHSGHGRRDALSASERTRVLRMLRDEGGRLADEDTKMIRVGDVAPHLVSPPPAQPPAQSHNATMFAHGAPAGQPPQQQQHSINATLFAHGGSQAPQGDAGAKTIMAQPNPQYQAPPPAQQHYQAPPAQPQYQAPPSQPQYQAPPAQPQYQAPPAQQHYHQAPPAPSPPGRFDEDATRRVDGEEALAALLDGADPTLNSDDDAGATQAMERPYVDPLSAGFEEPTRVGHMGELSMNKGPARRSEQLDAPTRAMDTRTLLRASGVANRPGPSEGAPTQAINLNQPGGGSTHDPHRRDGRQPPHDPRDPRK